MARARLRSRRQVVERCRALAELVGPSLPRRNGASERLEALWQGEGLGVLLWAFALAELPAYDRPFPHAALVRLDPGEARLRPAEEIADAREGARLWLWRARTADVVEDGTAPLPAPWESFDQLVAATAMRGHEQGVLPAPFRGDFPAFGTAYRSLDSDQRTEALAIAWERCRAFEWLLGAGPGWDEVVVDT